MLSTPFYLRIVYALLLLQCLSILGCKTSPTEQPLPERILDFSFSDSVYIAPCNVQFFNSSKNVEGYIWDFGDSTSTSTEMAPLHKYMKGGTYNIKLMSKDKLLSTTKQIIIKYPIPPVKLIHEPNAVIVPVGGNSWMSVDNINSGNIDNDGTKNWQNAESTLYTYIRLSKPGKLRWSCLAKVPDGESKFQFLALGKTVEFIAKGDTLKEYGLSEITVQQAGYIRIDLTGIAKTGKEFGLVTGLKVSGSAVDANISFVKNNTDNFFYWGRRGPSIHLGYDIPVNNVEWFYNEVLVPQNHDVVGSFFMANGFREGYFGFQVNSPTERRILFSVWSPFQTDNPNEIPEDQKIKLKRKGSDVYVGEFGNEGSGGQSYLRYNWKSGAKYKFLLRATPIGNNFTDYTAYFFAPEENKWRLIASFSRPKTNSFLQSLHSFVENFNPNTGNITRSAQFSNQWAVDINKKWHQVTSARLSGDNTAATGFRKDFKGGSNQSYFYLQHCGFFSDFTALGAEFHTSSTSEAPAISLNDLP